MANFSESRLEDGIVTLGMEGGAEFSTTVVSVNSGYEQRNQNWAQARGSWQLGNRTVRPAEFATLNAFFRARRGKLQGFRLKDWMDYKDDDVGVLGVPGQLVEAGEAVAGVTIYQMFKSYLDGDDEYLRKIDKPVQGTLKVFLDGVELDLGIGVGEYVPDFTTGRISITPGTSTITAATNASNAVFTKTAHGLADGDVVTGSGFTGGWAVMNAQAYTVDAIDADTFSLGVNSTGFGAFAAGSVKKGPQPGSALTWTGEFDVPVRFDIDKWNSKLNVVIHPTGAISNESLSYIDIGNLPVVEIRL